MRVVRRRAIGRSVVRTAATTAVVVGTAGAVRHAQDQKYNNQAAQQQAGQQQAYEQGLADAQAQQPAAATAAPASASNDLNSQLMQLSQLHNSGVLSDEEFAQAKQKLLNG